MILFIVPHREQHLKLFDQLKSTGSKLLSAPFFPYSGAAMIVESEKSQKEIEEVIKTDPYVTKNIVSKWSIKEFEGTTVETKRKFDRIAGDFVFRS